MSIIHKLSRSAGLFLSASVVEKLVGFVVLPIIGRVLGVQQLGVFATAGAIVFMLGFFSNAGLGAVAVREMARDRAKASDLFSRILSLRLLLSTLLYALLVAGIFAWPCPHNLRIILCLMGLSTISAAISGTCGDCSLAFERTRRLALVRSVASLLGAVNGITALVLAPVYKLEALVLAGVLTEAIVAFLWLRLVRRGMAVRLVMDPGSWKSLVQQALPYAGIIFIGQLNQSLGVFLLSTFRGPVPGQQAIGYLTPASSIARVPLFFLYSLRQILVPTVASLEHEVTSLAGILEWTVKVIFWMVFVPMTVACLFFPDLILFALFERTHFGPSLPALRLLGLAYALECLTLSITGYLAASREVHRFLPHAVAALALNFIVGWLLIPRYSFVGVAWGVLLAKVYMLGAVMVLCRRLYGWRMLPYRKFAALLPSGMTACLAAWLIRSAIPAPWWAAGLCGLLVAVAATYNLWRLRHLAGSISEASPAGQTHPACNDPLIEG